MRFCRRENGCKLTNADIAVLCSISWSEWRNGKSITLELKKIVRVGEDEQERNNDSCSFGASYAHIYYMNVLTVTCSF